MVVLKAVESKRNVRSNLRVWQKAFYQLGEAARKNVIWLGDHGIAFENWSRDEGHRYRHWYGLKSGSAYAERKLIVEVNPPDGGLPGRFQGVVAVDDAGQNWLLHAGEMNVEKSRVFLRDYENEHKLRPVSVVFSNGKTRPYYPVSNLALSSAKIVDSTKRFVDACLLVRMKFVGESDELVGHQRQALLLEESIESYVVPAQQAKTVEKIHGQIWHALRVALEKEGNEVSNERVGHLGPDLFTVNKKDHRLYEIKTDCGAPDCLKAVGQLLVYERALQKSFKKYLVVPRTPSAQMVAILSDLGISVITFAQAGKSYKFSYLAA